LYILGILKRLLPMVMHVKYAECGPPAPDAYPDPDSRLRAPRQYFDNFYG
jgi:hypothetical protein